jgi:spore maturation protein CgeB
MIDDRLDSDSGAPSVALQQLITRFGRRTGGAQVDLLHQPLVGPTPFTLPFPDDSVQCVTASLVSVAATAHDEWVREVWRVLASDGELILAGSADADSAPGEVAPESVAAVRHLAQRFELTDWLADSNGVVIRFRPSQGGITGEPEGWRTLAAELLGELQVAWKRLLQAEAEKARFSAAIASLEVDLAVSEVRRDEQRLLVHSQTRTLSEAVSALRLEIAAANSSALSARGPAEVDRLSARLEQAERKLRRAQWQLEVHKQRKWSRLGDEFVKTRRRPRSIVSLPRRSIRIIGGQSTRPPEPVMKAPKPERAVAANRLPTARTSRTVAAFPIPAAMPRRTDVRMATILDEFSELAFRFECEVIPCDRGRWRQQLERHRPDLLFVESAWNANGGEWQYTMAREDGPHEDLVELIEWCRENGIPTVFWNKEDPLEYDMFLPTARLFDWVVTVDANVLERYRQDLGHDRVEALPFAVQPAIHNPIGTFGGRRGAVAFAGTNYADKYPDRQRQLHQVVAPCVDLGLEIFSRFESNPKYRFPEPLSGCVVGSLSYPEMLNAYRQYKVFLNVNSVTDSPTMFSRRVLELLACGTPVVSGPSIGMSLMLNDVVPVPEDEVETKRVVKALLRSPETNDRLAVAGLRAVFSAHRYSDRLEDVLRLIGRATVSDPATVSILAPTNKPGAWKGALASVARQNYPDVELVMLVHGLEEDEGEIRDAASDAGVDRLIVVAMDGRSSLGEVLNAGVEASSGSYVAKFDDDDLYGPNYLSDQMLAFSYTEAGVVGKWTRFVDFQHNGALGLLFPGHEHRYTDLVGGGTILARRDVLDLVKFPAVTRGEDTGFLRACGAEGVLIYSTDRFNFVYTRNADPTVHTYSVSDDEHLAHSQIVAYGVDAERHAFM